MAITHHVYVVTQYITIIRHVPNVKWCHINKINANWYRIMLYFYRLHINSLFNFQDIIYIALNRTVESIIIVSTSILVSNRH